jgi:hypothetical protein
MERRFESQGLPSLAFCGGLGRQVFEGVDDDRFARLDDPLSPVDRPERDILVVSCTGRPRSNQSTLLVVNQSVPEALMYLSS